jgi:hypothetical protein
MLNIQHRFNPLHIHCRMVEKGLGKEFSASLSRWYGILVYSWLVRLTIMAVWISKRVKEETGQTNTRWPVA